MLSKKYNRPAILRKVAFYHLQGNLMSKILSVFLLSVVFTLTGCASIVDGSEQMIVFQSMPNDAEIYIDGKLMGKTPLTVPVERAEGKSFTIRKDGYKEQTIKMPVKLNPTFWGNLIIGGAVGSSTDSSTGAIHEYAPGSYVLNLEKVGA